MLILKVMHINILLPKNVVIIQINQTQMVDRLGIGLYKHIASTRMYMSLAQTPYTWANIASISITVVNKGILVHH